MTQIASTETYTSEADAASAVSGLSPYVTGAQIQAEGVSPSYYNPFAVGVPYATVAGVTPVGSFGQGIAIFANLQQGITAWWQGLSANSLYANVERLISSPQTTTVQQYYDALSSAGYGGSPGYGAQLGNIFAGNTGLDPSSTTLAQAAALPAPGGSGFPETSTGQPQGTTVPSSGQGAQPSTSPSAAGSSSAPLSFTQSIVHLLASAGVAVVAISLIIVGLLILFRGPIGGGIQLAERAAP